MSENSIRTYMDERLLNDGKPVRIRLMTGDLINGYITDETSEWYEVKNNLNDDCCIKTVLVMKHNIAYIVIPQDDHSN